MVHGLSANPWRLLQSRAQPLSASTHQCRTKRSQIPIPLQPVAPRLWDTFHPQRTQRADLLLTRGNEAKLPKFSSDNTQEAGCELCHLAFTQLLVPRQVQLGGG